jgi:hypothetical protein
LIDFLGESIAVNAQPGGGAYQIAVISSQNLSDKASLKMLRGLGEKDAFLDHFPANSLQTLFEPERRFGVVLAHEALRF